jgi:hypothetical protein
VVACLVFRAGSAIEPAERILDVRKPFTVAQLDPVPVGKRRHPAREVLGNALLVSGEQAEGEAARRTQELVHGGLLAHGDADEGWLQGKRDDRADGEAQANALGVDGQDGDPGGKAA